MTDDEFFAALRRRRSSSSEGGERLSFEELRQKGLAVMASFDEASLHKCDAESNCLSRDSLELLLGFAWASSMECVRRSDPQLLLEGLRALAVGGGRLDYRDSLVRMAALHSSALILKQDPTALFNQASTLASSVGFAELLRDFPKRPQRLRDLTAFDISVSPKGGFTYEFFVSDE